MTNNNQNTSTYFISYSHYDADFTLRLADDLRAAGINVWLDTRDISTGAVWDEVLEQALRASEGIIVVLTPASADSAFVRKEILFAQNHHKKVYPLLAKPTEIPLLIADSQVADCSFDYSAGLQALTTSLLHDSGATETASPGILRRIQWIGIRSFSFKRAVVGMCIGGVYGVAITRGLNLGGQNVAAMAEGWVVYGFFGALAALLTPRSYRALTFFSGGFLAAHLLLWLWLVFYSDKGFQYVLVIGPIIGAIAGVLLSRLMSKLH